MTFQEWENVALHGSSEINLDGDMSVLLGNTVILGVQQQEVKVTVSLFHGEGGSMLSQHKN